MGGNSEKAVGTPTPKILCEGSEYISTNLLLGYGFVEQYEMNSDLKKTVARLNGYRLQHYVTFDKEQFLCHQCSYDKTKVPDFVARPLKTGQLTSKNYVPFLGF